MPPSSGIVPTAPCSVMRWSPRPRLSHPAYPMLFIGRHRRWPHRSSRSYRTCAAGERTSGFEHEDTASPRRSRLTGLWCCVVERGGRHRLPEVVQVGEYLPTLVLLQEEARRKLVDDRPLSVVQSDRSSSGDDREVRLPARPSRSLVTLHSSPFTFPRLRQSASRAEGPRPVPPSPGVSPPSPCLPPRVAIRAATIVAVMAAAITSNEARMGISTPIPCATNFAPTKTRIAARP